MTTSFGKVYNRNTGQEENIHFRWQLPTHKLNKALSQAKIDLIAMLTKSKSNLAYYLLTHHRMHVILESCKIEQADTFSQEVVHYLTLDIFSEAKNVKDGTNQVIILSLILEQGNRDGAWHIPLPNVPIHIEHEKNPYQPKRLENLQHTPVWSQAVISSIDQEIELSDFEKVGRLLVSAMSRGGLLNKDSVLAFYKQLDQPLHIVNNISYINLALRWRGQDDQEQRRWYPDSLTEALLLTTHIPPSVSKRQAWTAIKSFYKACGIRTKQAPSSITKLIDAFALEAEFSIPLFLAGYATRKNVSHSLKNEAWLRLQNAKPLKPINDDYSSKSTYQNDEENFSEFGSSNWYKGIKKALNTANQKEALTALHNIQPSLESVPLTSYLKNWASHLLQHGTQHTKKLALNTVRNYVGRISYRLFGVVANGDFSDFSPEDFEDIYIQILEDEGKSRRNIARILREFHHYLTLKHNAPDLDYSVLGASHTLCPVDANIINIEDYIKTLDQIDRSELDLKHPDLILITKILTILAFKCGLRRSEALKLRLIDVQGEIASELLIRPHTTRRLKSRSSTRRILLYLLLNKSEYEMFTNWVTKRLQQETQDPYSEYLFSIPKARYELVPAELIIPAIHKALRQVTGDETLRFHSLRHSCASWSLLQLVSTTQSVPEKFFQSMPKTLSWLKKSKLHKGLYLHEKTSRKHLYAISMMLGHSSPAITLEHYIHWCDIMLHHALEKQIKPIEKKTWVKATGVAQATIYKLLKKGAELNLLKKLRANTITHCIPLRNPKHSTSHLEPSPLFTAYPIIMRAWKLLYQFSTKDMDIEDLSERYGFTIKEAKRMIKIAQDLEQEKHSGRHKGYKYKLMTEQNMRLLCPRKPTTYSGKILAEDFAEKLQTLKEHHYDRQLFFTKIAMNTSKLSSNNYVFQTPLNARLFLKSLKLMTVQMKYIKLEWLFGCPIEGKTNKERKQYWREELSINKNRPFKSKKVNDTRPLGENGWISIQIQDYLNNNASPQSTEAFRFVFMMQTILDYTFEINSLRATLYEIDFENKTYSATDSY